MNKRAQPWQKEVPAYLVPAVSFLHESFDQSIWETEVPTKALCFLRLHGGDSKEIDRYELKLEKTKEIVGSDAAHLFEESVAIGTLPAIFHGFHELFLRSMAVSVRSAFLHLIEIEEANTRALGSPQSLKWAAAQATYMIETTAQRMRNWVRDVCDRESPYDPDRDDLDSWINRKTWRAPSFIIRRRTFEAESNPDRDWFRQSEENTVSLLTDFGEHCVSRNEAVLGLAAGEAALVKAKAAGANALTFAERTPSSPSNLTKPAKRLTPMSKAVASRHKTICEIVEGGEEGVDYCRVMDERKMQPARGWKEDGWPGSYVAAYNSSNVKARAKWKAKINREKSRHKKR